MQAIRISAQPTIVCPSEASKPGENPLKRSRTNLGPGGRNRARALANPNQARNHGAIIGARADFDSRRIRAKSDHGRSCGRNKQCYCLAMLSSLKAIESAIETDPTFSAWEITETGDHFVAIRSSDVVLVLAAPALWLDAKAIAPHWVRARSGNYTLLLVGTDEELEKGAADAVGDEFTASALVTVPITTVRLSLTLTSTQRVHGFRLDLAKRELSLERARYERDLLIGVGRALSSERDTTELLRRILSKAREVTGADAGSVYIARGDLDDPNNAHLQFIASENDSRDIESTGFTMPISESSIVGTCTLSGDVINVPDLYKLDSPGTGNNPWHFVHDKSWDERVGYQTRSMVTVPMISARNQVIGVIQLINKRARGVVLSRDSRVV